MRRGRSSRTCSAGRSPRREDSPAIPSSTPAPWTDGRSRSVLARARRRSPLLRRRRGRHRDPATGGGARRDDRPADPGGSRRLLWRPRRRPRPQDWGCRGLAARGRKEPAMRYMLLIYMGQSTAEWEQLSEVEQEQILHEYRALSEARGVTGGEQLQPVDTATTVRVQDRQTLITDGPFAATRRCSAVITCSTSTTSTLRSRSRSGSQPRGWAGRSRSARWWSADRARLREEWGRVLGTMMGFLGDFDRAEEATPVGFRRRRGTLAAGRRPQSPRLAGRDRAQHGDRPDSPRADAGREDPAPRAG